MEIHRDTPKYIEKDVKKMSEKKEGNAPSFFSYTPLHKKKDTYWGSITSRCFPLMMEVSRKEVR